MKLLYDQNLSRKLDQNLSRKLVTRLADIFPSASHVQFHGLAEKTDTANIEEAIALYIEVLQDRGEPVPEDTIEVVLI